MNEKSRKRNRLIRNMAIGVFIGVLCLAALTVFLIGINLPLAAGFCAVVLALALVVRWHARTTTYACPTCGHTFQISAWTDFLSPHFPHKKLLVCPSCSATDWCPEA